MPKTVTQSTTTISQKELEDAALATAQLDGHPVGPDTKVDLLVDIGEDGKATKVTARIVTVVDSETSPSPFPDAPERTPRDTSDDPVSRAPGS